jgi:hypothetical protein
MPLDRPRDDVLVERAGDDEVGEPRSIVGLVERDHVVAREVLDRLRASRGEPAVRGVGGVDVHQEHLVGESPGLGSRLQDVSQALGLEALELAVVEAGLAQHLGQQAEALVEVLRQ